MARPLRIEYEGGVYHVTSRGNERRKIFFCKSDYEKFKSYLRQAQDKYDYLLHCYMLMTNHYHLLIETRHGNLSKIMHYINGSYTNYVNRRRGRSGHLFQGRYKAIVIDKDSYLLELSRYLHLNPVRANIVAKPEDYPYSSYRSYCFKEGEAFVHRDLILSMVSIDSRYAPTQYRDFVENVMDEKLDDPLKQLYGGALLGRKAFIKDVLDRVNNASMQRQETSHRRDLDNAYAVELVLESVAAYFRASPDEVKKGKGVYRSIAIHLLKKWTSITNKQIGDLLGGLSYSAVSKVNQRFSAKLSTDRRLRRTVNDITDSLSHVKG